MSFLTTLHIAKQNFKFSAAHFLIFNDKDAERLHGHNYKVRIEVDCPPDQDDQGYFIDFNVLKKLIKARLDQWDEMVLLPQKHKDMKIKIEGPSMQVNFRERYYVFPKNEVVLLNITNTSVEQLSRLLAEDFLQMFQKMSISKLRVSVEESEGQGAWTEVQT